MLRATPFEGTLAQHLPRAQPNPVPGFRLFWLGQAGFLIEAGGYRLLIDPYLSDSLGEKYAGTPTPHARMAAAPIAPEALGAIDLVLCTHRHTDHMDPATLKPLGKRLPNMRFVVPAAGIAEALTRTGVGQDRLIPVDACDRIEPLPGLVLSVAAAAHETLETDANGRHRFLGYALSLGGVTLFHSGDTIPFPGQREAVQALGANLALLPVNGRSPSLLQGGFAGNMTLDEALTLCRDCAIGDMVAHHYGMFAFNTVDPGVIDQAAAGAAPVRLERARFGVEYRLGSDGGAEES